jgi:hypothetical protein
LAIIIADTPKGNLKFKLSQKFSSINNRYKRLFNQFGLYIAKSLPDPLRLNKNGNNLLVILTAKIGKNSSVLK